MYSEYRSSNFDLDYLRKIKIIWYNKLKIKESSNKLAVFSWQMGMIISKLFATAAFFHP